MSTWKVESDWIYDYNAVTGEEKQRIRIELQTCADMVVVFRDWRETPESSVISRELFCCDVIAARTIADLLVLNLKNYCALNGEAAALIRKLEGDKR